MATKYGELGRLGQKRSGGLSLFYEEFLWELQGIRGIETYKEMSENNSTIGAILFAVENLMRQCEFDIEPGGTSQKDREAAEFVKGCMNDMTMTWTDTLSEILTFITYGWSYHEIVYKRRMGKTGNLDTNSKYDDGLIGWKKLPIRGQETLYEWIYKDEYSDDLLGMRQQVFPSTDIVDIPLEKALHFRTRSRKDNPEGRALALDTLIPTPDGWKTMKELKVGDKVFDEQGKVRYVTGEKTWENRPCYKLKFSDGTEIIADENHTWLTFNQYERNHKLNAKERTTKEIFETLKNSKGVSNHAIQLTKPLDYPKQGLILDPYYLGQWLGDGTCRTANITTHVDDAEETLSYFDCEGEVIPNGKKGGLGRIIKIKNKGIMGSPIEKLRALLLIQNKHIPENYLRGDYEQRLALLQGLMDSDGTVDNFNRCTFTNCNKNLADGVYELVCSLGCLASKSTKLPDGKRRKHISYQVKFTPTTFNPFRLERKRKLVKQERSRNLHYIVSCEPVENRTTKCIEVDSPSHLYLAGEAMIPTHNSVLRNAYEPWYYQKRIREIEGMGIERDLAGLPLIEAPEGLDIWDAEDEEMKQALANAEKLITNIRRDTKEGVVLPFGWKLSLLTSGSRRQFDTNAIIERYSKEMATTVLGDFILLGHEGVGSFALADNKTKMFALAVGSYLDIICEVFNNQGIPRLIDINGDHFKGITDYPKMKHSDIEDANLDKIGTFLSTMTSSGIITPDDDLEDYVRKIGNLPERKLDVSPEERKGETGEQGNDKGNGKVKKPDSLKEEKEAEQKAERGDMAQAEEAKKSLGRFLKDKFSKGE